MISLSRFANNSVNDSESPLRIKVAVFPQILSKLVVQWMPFSQCIILHKITQLAEMITTQRKNKMVNFVSYFFIFVIN